MRHIESLAYNKRALPVVDYGSFITKMKFGLTTSSIKYKPTCYIQVLVLLHGSETDNNEYLLTYDNLGSGFGSRAQTSVDYS